MGAFNAEGRRCDRRGEHRCVRRRLLAGHSDEDRAYGPSGVPCTVPKWFMSPRAATCPLGLTDGGKRPANRHGCLLTQGADTVSDRLQLGLHRVEPVQQTVSRRSARRRRPSRTPPRLGNDLTGRPCHRPGITAPTRSCRTAPSPSPGGRCAEQLTIAILEARKGKRSISGPGQDAP